MLTLELLANRGDHHCYDGVARELCGRTAAPVRRPEHASVEGDDSEVFRARCAACHPLERAYLYLETELEPHWELLVRRMQAKAPEWITDAEAEAVVRYLSAQQPQLRTPVGAAVAAGE